MNYPETLITGGLIATAIIIVLVVIWIATAKPKKSELKCPWASDGSTCNPECKTYKHCYAEWNSWV